MGRDWSRGALDDLIVEPRLARAGPLRVDRPRHAAAQQIPVRFPLERFGLAGMCVLVGLMAAFLYVWPVLLMTQILADGIPGTIYWSVLAGSVVLATVVAWAITIYERGYWSRNWMKISEWVDPEPWK